MSVNPEKVYRGDNPYEYDPVHGPEGVWTSDRKEAIEFSEKFKVDKKWKDVRKQQKCFFCVLSPIFIGLGFCFVFY